MMEETCNYCRRKVVGWMAYEGLHRVCSKHKQVIQKLADKGLLGIRFQDELEKTREVTKCVHQR